MPAPIESQALPKSLRAMISDATAAVESWPVAEPKVDDDGIMEAGKAWAVRLSHGEYDAELYWECTAQDSEEAGNWEDAKAAYQKIVSVAQESFKRGDAYSSLGTLCSILGEFKQALAYFHAASSCEQEQDCKVFYRYWLAQESRHLLRMGRVRAAKKLALRGFATFETGHSDNLNFALLHIVVAACELDQGDVISAERLLSDAWEAMEALRRAFEQSDMDLGSGVHSAYSQWWRQEAKRRHLTGHSESEIEACKNSVDHARNGAVGWNRIGWDIAIVFALESLADACLRNGRLNESSEARAEADRIRDKWHLPAIDKSPSERSSYMSWLWNLFSFGR
jgi:tetratricopeptide (TPR) repeat protein